MRDFQEINEYCESLKVDLASKTLVITEGNVTLAAKMLKTGRATLYRLISKRKLYVPRRN